jgi:hypothetical protein
MKQETLEEVCDKVLNYLHPNCKKEMSNLQYTNSINSLKFIAKWQQERSYSEEEVLNLCRDFAIFIQQKRPSYKKQLEWFEQFKKQGGDK